MRKKTINVNKPSSNYDLRDWLSARGVPAYVFSADEIPEGFTGFAVINHLPSGTGGSHWTGLYRPENSPDSYVFDAFGGPPLDIIDRLTAHETCWYSDRMIQSFDSYACGWFVAAWAEWMARGVANGLSGPSLRRHAKAFVDIFETGDDRTRFANNQRLVDLLNDRPEVPLVTHTHTT